MIKRGESMPADLGPHPCLILLRLNATHNIALWSLEMRHFIQSCMSKLYLTNLSTGMLGGEHVKCLAEVKVQSICNSSFIHWVSGFITENIMLVKHNSPLVNLSWVFPAIFFLVFPIHGKTLSQTLAPQLPPKM